MAITGTTLYPVPVRASWRDSAACDGKEPTDWYLAGAWQRTAGNERAVRICLGCPVRDECLDDAVRGADWGVIRGARRIPQPLEYADCVACGHRFLRTRRRTNTQRLCHDPCGRVPAGSAVAS